jgi:DMSO reductase anchor subunit
MIYHATRRDLWTAQRTAPRFLLTAAALGGAAGLVALSLAPGADPATAGALRVVVVAATVADLLLEVARRRPLQPTPALARTAALLAGPLGDALALRLALGALGGVALPLTLLAHPSPALAAAALLLATAGALLSRRLFFASVSPDRMPGAL